MEDPVDAKMIGVALIIIITVGGPVVVNFLYGLTWGIVTLVSMLVIDVFTTKELDKREEEYEKYWYCVVFALKNGIEEFKDRAVRYGENDAFIDKVIDEHNRIMTDIENRANARIEYERKRWYK